MQAAFPKAQVVVFEKAGHNSFNDAPELFFTEFKKFVLQITGLEFCRTY